MDIPMEERPADGVRHRDLTGIDSRRLAGVSLEPFRHTGAPVPVAPSASVASAPLRAVRAR